jgi:hypothetical protein
LRAGVFASARCRRSRTISSRKEITPVLEQRFLDSLATTASVTRAARLTRRHRSTWYRHRAEHPAFASAWAEAVERGTDALEDEAVRRAVEGVLKPVFHQGKRVGTIRVFSDALLTFLLKARRPDKFADRAAPIADTADDLIARLKAGRARIEQRAAAPEIVDASDADAPDGDTTDDIEASSDH